MQLEAEFRVNEHKGQQQNSGVYKVLDVMPMAVIFTYSL